MNFSCACISDHANDFAAGGAANNRIVNEHHAFAFQQAAHGIQLQLHAKVTYSLPRFDERTADIVIANQAKAKWNSAFRGVAHGGGHA